MFLDPQVVADLVPKIRRLHASEAAELDAVDGSNNVDDRMDDVLVDGMDGGNLAEIVGALEGFESEQMEESVALILLGRDADVYASFGEAKSAGRDRDASVMEIILNDPMTAEYLVAGLDFIGRDAVSTPERQSGPALAPERDDAQS